MASTDSPSIPHRSVATIRTSATTGGIGASVDSSAASGVKSSTPAPAPTTPGAGTSAAPTTPLRTYTSAFSSPASSRAEDETVVMEMGSRQLRVGLAGDVAARATMAFGPEQQRRVGDLRAWTEGYVRDWQTAAPDDWDATHALWQADLRTTDLGLVADRLERALHAAYSQHLLVDSRPRRALLAVPPAMPLPLLDTTMDVLFRRFQAPSVSLVSAPVAAAVAGGLRSALVVDVGWAETVVTSVYELREVASARTVRAGRMLVQHVHDLLAEELAELAEELEPVDDTKRRHHVLSVDECEDVTARLVWCRQVDGPSRANGVETEKKDENQEKQPEEGSLATVAETDETEHDAASTYSDAKSRSSSPVPGDRTTTRVPLSSCTPPRVLTLPFDRLADPCETTFFGGTGPGRDTPACWDDEEFPVPLLIVRHLQRLPVDVRAVCMSRIVFAGGCANVLGLRARIFDEVARLVAEHGWDIVRGGRKKKNDLDSDSDAEWHDVEDVQKGHVEAETAETDETDKVEAEIRRTRQRGDSTAADVPGRQPVQQTNHTQGRLRAVASLGPFAGASLLAQLRVPALATVDREQWVHQGGVAGASRASDVDAKVLQRQSLGPGHLRAVTGTASLQTASWTLGAWGVL